MPESETVVEPGAKPGFNAELRARFRQGREDTGVSAAQLGGAIGISAQAVSQFELGKQRLDLELFAAACEALGLNVRWVLFGRGHQRDVRARVTTQARRPARRTKE